jgi:hypothetical protein
MAVTDRVCKVCKKEFRGDQNTCTACRQAASRAKKERVEESLSAPEIKHAIVNADGSMEATPSNLQAVFNGDPIDRKIPWLEDPTEADYVWWDINGNMEDEHPHWANWGPLVENECSGCKPIHKFKTHLRLLRDCGARA